MKTAALVMAFTVGVSRVGTGMAAPLSDLATVSLRNTHATKGFGAFALRGDGTDYRLGSRVGLVVDYQEMGRRAVHSAHSRRVFQRCHLYG